MREVRVRHNTPRLGFGLVVIFLGVLFTLDKLGYLDVGDYWRYWPALLIAAGLGRVLEPRGCHRRGFGVVLIVVGAWWLLANLHVIPYRVWDFWPVLLVLVGASMVWQAMGRPGGGGPRGWHDIGPSGGPGEETAADSATGRIGGAAAAPATGDGDVSATADCFALLGGSHRRCVSPDFRGGSLTAIMGGCELDLRQASIASGEAVLDTFACWGGIEIKVPDDWTVVLQGTPILGAFEDKTVHAGGATKKVLVVKGVAIMGGVEVKN